MNRLENIDLLRFISIVIVMFSHYGLLQGFFLGGTHGVVIFFMVSGYCMQLTVHHKKNFVEFWGARFWRLVPTFIICATIVTLVENLLPFIRPDRLHSWSDLILNIICTPTLDIPCGITYIISKKYGMYKLVDGAYWSLMVEFRYYALFSILFYFFKISKLNPILITLMTFLGFFTQFYFAGTPLKRLNDFFMYLPFFSFGMAYYQMKKENRWWGLFSLTSAILVFSLISWIGLNQVSMGVNRSNFLSYLICFVIFFIIMELAKNSSNILLKALCYVGVLSYPIYLLHQDIGYILIGIGKPYFGHTLSSLITILFISLLAHFLHKLFEVKLIPYIRNYFLTRTEKKIIYLGSDTKPIPAGDSVTSV